jgi:hypothetical protein
MDSSLYSEVLGAQESAGDTLGGFTWNGSDSADDVKEQVNDILQEVRDAIESVASQYEDAAESMGGDSGAGAQFAEWAQTLQDSEIMDWEAGDYDDPDETEAWCEKHTDDMVGDEPDQVSASDIDQAREDCEDCKPDLSDWTADLVAEAQEKVDAVSKE